MLLVKRGVVAAVVGHRAALTVYAAAEPEPRFTWYNGSIPLTLGLSTDSRRVDITTASHGDSEACDTKDRRKTVYCYSSTLRLSHVNVWDLTEYRVIVDNDYGSNKTSLSLIQASEYSMY